MRAVSALDKVWAEIEIMRHLYHRHVVLLFEVCLPLLYSIFIDLFLWKKVLDDADVDKLYLVLEFMSGGQTLDFDDGLKYGWQCG